MKDLPSLESLIISLSSLPSIGSKTAERLAFNIIDKDDEEINLLIKSITNAKKRIHHCPICGILTEFDNCSICSNKERDHSICIVISQSKDVFNFEKISSFNGTYHVLNGDLSSIKGITPDKLRINELIERIPKENIREIIIATNPTIEGETTALYLSRILKDFDIKITRLAYGLPANGQLEYVDELTIEKAIKNRTNLK